MNKKLTKAFALLLAAVLLLSACGGAKTADPETQLAVKERGVIFEVPKNYQDMGVSTFLPTENAKGYKNITLNYFGTEAMQNLTELTELESTEENKAKAAELYQRFLDTSRCLMEVVIVEEADYNQAVAGGAKAEDFTVYTPAEYYKTSGGYAYIIATPDEGAEGLNEQDAKDYATCLAYVPTIKKNLQLTAVDLSGETTTVGDTMPDFKTVDLNGNEVTSEIFQNKQLTVVNFWGTFCNPCIQEMPELEALYQKYSDKVQFLGIVGDIQGTDDTKHLELAKTIMEKAGVTFPSLIPNDTFKGQLQGIIGFPTTIFVDPAGNIIGEPIVGSDVPRTEEFIQSVIR